MKICVAQGRILESRLRILANSGTSVVWQFVTLVQFPFMTSKHTPYLQKTFLNEPLMRHVFRGFHMIYMRTEKLSLEKIFYDLDENMDYVIA